MDLWKTRLSKDIVRNCSELVRYVRSVLVSFRQYLLTVYLNKTQIYIYKAKIIPHVETMVYTKSTRIEETSYVICRVFGSIVL